jgi:two-component system sensor histidine kinase DctS
VNNAPAPPRHALEALRPRDRGRKRALLWSTLVLLLVVAQTLLVILTVRDEATRAQEDTEGVVLQAAVDVRRQLLAAVAPLQTLASRGGAPSTPAAGFDEGAQALMRSQPSMLHVERRSASLRIEQAVSSDLAPPLFEQLPRSGLGQDAEGRRCSRAATSCPCLAAWAWRSSTCACRNWPPGATTATSSPPSACLC